MMQATGVKAVIAPEDSFNNLLDLPELAFDGHNHQIVESPRSSEFLYSASQSRKISKTGKIKESVSRNSGGEARISCGPIDAASDYNDTVHVYHRALMEALNKESAKILKKATGHVGAGKPGKFQAHDLDSPREIQARDLETRLSARTAISPTATDASSDSSETTSRDTAGYNYNLLRKWALMSASLTQDIDLCASLRRSWRAAVEIPPEYDIEIHPDWLPSPMASRARLSSTRKDSVAFHKGQLPVFGSQVRNHNKLQFFVINPDSDGHLVWLLTGGLLLLYDAFTIPLDAVDLWLEVPSSFNYFCVAYWTMDILINLFTGYWDSGIVEMRPEMTVKRYANKTLLRDIVIVATDWVFVFVGFEDFIGSFRLFRLFRLTRLMRLAKLSQFIRMLVSSVTKNPTELMFTVGRLLALILFMNHYMACAWYGIGIHTGSAFGDSWVHASEMSLGSPFDRYIISMQWTLAQFTPATNDVFAQNTAERAYAVFVVLTGLCMFSSFVSGVTGAVNEVQMLTINRVSSRSSVNDFLKRKLVSAVLAAKIFSYFDENFGRKRMQQECDVEFLAELPSSIKIQLREQLYLPSLVAYPVFKMTCDHYRNVYVCLCQKSVRDVCYLKNEEIFAETEEGQFMRVICSGSVVYNCSNSSAACTLIEKKSYVISDQAFWLKWVHPGSLRCQTDSVISECDCPTMRALIFKFAGEVYSFFRITALLYTHVISTPGSLVTDLPLEKSRLEDLTNRGLCYCGTPPMPKPIVFSSGRIAQAYYRGLVAWRSG